MKGGTSGRVNKKALAVGAVTVIALAAMAMVYYSAYSTATVTATQILEVYSEPSGTTLYAPGIWTNQDFGKVNVTVSSIPGSSVTYRLIIDAPALGKGATGDLSDIRSIAIAVYKDDGDHQYDSGDELKGFLTPWTPTLVINDTATSIGNKTYFLKLNGIAYKDGTITIGVRASVELVSA
ncbi:MAG: hypothetical protein OD814_000417 [Candidatus Alkanophagales archaeon MCA70_species_1]|nr:hypothetical protein [Candidatus Alkanophaga volatiphilum]